MTAKNQYQQYPDKNEEFIEQLEETLSSEKHSIQKINSFQYIIYNTLAVTNITNTVMLASNQSVINAKHSKMINNKCEPSQPNLQTLRKT